MHTRADTHARTHIMTIFWNEAVVAEGILLFTQVEGFGLLLANI